MNAIAMLRHGSTALAGGGMGGGGLTARQKAAVIVRLVLSEGGALPLARLPEELQTELTAQIAGMKMVDRQTLAEVVAEFCDRIEDVGLSFPSEIDEALTLVDGHISAAAASRLRRMAAAAGRSDPWERISSLSAEMLLPVLEEESTEVGAVMLSKLSVTRAAELLSRLPGEKARRIAYAVSLTGNIAPETVQRIGTALAAQFDSLPPKAFADGPVERVGAILNSAQAATREDVLQGLEEEDLAFAEEVKKAIFTFAHIPTRIDPRDVPKILRVVEQPLLLTALAGAKGADAKTAEFILSSISQRMAATLRDEIGSLGKISDKDAEAAMGTVIAAIRSLEAEGTLFLVALDDD